MHLIRAALLACLCPLLCAGQQDPPRYFVRSAMPDTPATAVGAPGAVTIHEERPVEQLMERFAAMRHPQPGYRVQVFLGDRKGAEETKRQFLQRNPSLPAYQSWLAPNWRLRVGDCRTRLEAERLLHELRPQYPGCFIVPDDIEMPALVTPGRTPSSPPPGR